MALSLFYLYPIYQVSLLRNLEAIIINEKKKKISSDIYLYSYFVQNDTLFVIFKR